MGLVSSIVLTVHLLCMNVVAAGPLLCAWLDRKLEKNDPNNHAAVRFLATLCCTLFVVGAVLGLIVGWLQWSDSYRECLAKFAYRIRWGAIEYAFSGVLLVVYAVWVYARPAVGLAAWITRTSLAAASSTNLLYHFPPLFSLIASAAAGQLELVRHVDSATYRQLIAQGKVLALTSHFSLASFAVAGMVLVLFGSGLFGSRSKKSPVMLFGARTALVSTLGQIPVGLWLLLQMSPGEQRRLMGADLAAAILFVSAVLGTFWLLHQLAAIAFGDASTSRIWRATAAMVGVVALMTGVLSRGQPRRESALDDRTQAVRLSRLRDFENCKMSSARSISRFFADQPLGASTRFLRVTNVGTGR